MIRYFAIGSIFITTALPAHAQPLECTGRLNQETPPQQVIDAMQCLERMILEQPRVAGFSHAKPMRPNPDAIAPLRVYAEELSKRAQNGAYGSTKRGAQIADDYASLIAQMQAAAALRAEPFVLALEPLSAPRDPDQAATAVSGLAAGLGEYLTNLDATRALNMMFRRLTSTAQHGVYGISNRAEVLRDQYNLVVRVTKAVFPDDPYVQAQPEYNTIHDPDEIAATILQAARSLAAFTETRSE